MGNIQNIDKDPLGMKSKDHPYMLIQPGGKVLHFKNALDYQRAKRAMDQSLSNCQKTVIGGGFNPNNVEEKIWVETGKWPREK